MRYRRVRIEGGTYFFTVVTYKRRPIFKDTETVLAFQNAVADIQTSHPFDIPAYVILPDHLHALWTLPEGDSDYPMRWRMIKSAFTRNTRHKFDADPAPASSRAEKSERTLWQRRYWEHTIRGDADFTAHVEYIHFNPVKHGLANRPRDWPHSTFQDWVARGAYDASWGGDVELESFATAELD